MSRPTDPTAAALTERVRRLCLSLPEATERVSHGEAAWFVRRSPQFVTMADRHHDDRVALWAAAPPGAQQDWVRRAPEHYFVPPYVGGRGWIGVYLDREPDWDAVADIVEDAYRTVAPARLLQRFDTSRDSSPG